ncbi:histidine phosphatase superfamily [Parachaetomium inaequale]|uniref:Histidine phosphatase superfamily n=1 Tax=Parachaetomium inaequale TaxID=2588326 RepID=A0AAN6P795_9PEZI|nr:histidine phosphatase superfamily [Parachaetomium inaequale]
MESLGFESLEFDACLFRNNELGILVVLYVDDLLIAAPDTKLIDRTRDGLKRSYDLKELGEDKRFLGFDVIRDREARKLGVYIFHRHGDRTSKEWPPTSLTALGADQVLSSGTYFRNRYVESGASTPIASLSHDLAVLSQLTVTAPVDNVLQNSAQVFLQGLYPPAGSAATQKLANGTATDPPLGGYQYIPSSSLLTPETLHQLQTLADQHEWGLAYNASSPIRAVSGSVLAAQILSSLNTTLTTSTKTSGLQMGIQFGAYGTFMAFFGLAQLPAASADFTGIVDYASAFVLELVTNSTAKPPAPADVSVRFLFSNGSAGLSEQGLQAFPLFGRAETTLPWTTFVEEMGKISLGDTADCTTSSGGDGGEGGGGVSRAAAGVIGALVAIVVVLLLEALVMAVAGLRVAKKKGLSAKESQADDRSTSTR